LVTPQRTSGGGRRYSARDIERLREIQHLSGAGIGLTGVKRILDLEQLADQLGARVRQLEADLEAAHRALTQLQQGSTPGTDVVLRDSAAVVVWRRPPRPSL
jgi:MerR family transcriptional regulator/heat shock protein HspR